MNMREELKALSDKARDRVDDATAKYRAALKKNDNGMAAVIRGQWLEAVAYAEALEDCRRIVRRHS
jgi:hypothetical protein